MSAEGTGEAISNALLGHLGALSFSPVVPIAWPNVDFTPPQSGPYLHPAIIKNKTQPTAFRTDELMGIFQVSIYSPLMLGSAPSEKIADQIIDHFSRGTWISHEGVTVRVRNAWTSVAMRDGSWWHLPVSVDWFVQKNF